MHKSIPNALSICALTLACFGVYFLLKNQLYFAFGLILLATVLDMYDGFLARKHNAVSDVGVKIDTMHDIVNYIIFPVLLFGGWYFLVNGIFYYNSSYFILPLFLCCSLARLWIFSKRGLLEKNDHLYYQGMPVYYIHVLILALILLQNFHYFITTLGLPIASLLMISPIPFRKPTNIVLWSVVLLGLAFYFLV